MIAQISVSLSWGQLTVVGAILVALHVITGMVLNAIITHHVRGEIDREIEDYRTELRRIEHAARIAELLAAAVDPDGVDDPQRFNQLTWELSLWLPEPLVRELSDCLTGTANRDPRELLAKVRKYLHGDKDSMDWRAISFVPASAYRDRRTSRLLSYPRQG